MDNLTQPYTRLFELVQLEDDFLGVYTLEPTFELKLRSRWKDNPDMALMFSICKWHFIVMALFAKEDILFIRCGGTETCDLCYHYLDQDCIGCPIQEHNRDHHHCNGTPIEQYADLENVLDWVDDEDRTFDNEQLLQRARYFALEELKWLIEIAIANQTIHIDFDPNELPYNAFD